MKRLKLEGHIQKVLANNELDTSMKKRNKLGKLQDYLIKNRYGKDEVLIVGDSPEEPEIGKKTGVKSVSITNGYYSTKRLKNSKPDFIIDNLSQLKKIIKTFRQ